eukprot:368267-Prorocentrum_minimum.AAC.2
MAVARGPVESVAAVSRLLHPRGHFRPRVGALHQPLTRRQVPPPRRPQERVGPVRVRLSHRIRAPPH